MSFSIRDLENLSGIKAHTIRIWEQRYSFLKPQRTTTNIRNYTNEELKVILNVALLNKYGYKISNISKLSDGELREKILSLTQTQAQQERIVIDLLKHMIDMDMEGFETLIDGYIAARGMEKSVVQVIFPFLEKIGVLWQTSHIIPAQEHLVSNIIRQKLCVAINSLKISLNNNRSVCCFLPEGEFHELGLLYMHYMMKNRGFNVIYLGASVPIEDVQYVVSQKKPEFLLTHITTLGHNLSFERLMTSLAKKFPAEKVIVTGSVAGRFEKKIPSSLHYKRSHTEVLDMLNADV
jgi:MerR family transcriptional regulator, light-induced transcriptional regulator